MSIQLPNLSTPKPSVGSNPLLENLSQVKSIIAISSGKGGVGKSTVASNLATALAKQGFKVGLMDADVYGPTVAKMMGGKDAHLDQKDGKLIPIVQHDVAWVSMALLTNEDTPVIWRGPMATKLIQQFLGAVAWGKLDYLLIDLPPGTGDVQLTLTQAVPLTGAVVVSTPQEVAVDVTMRGIKMFEEVRVPILGIIENMSGFICSHCDHETPIFTQGNLENRAKSMGLHFLGSVPMDPAISVAGDMGAPIATTDSVLGNRFMEIGKNLHSIVEDVESKTKETIDSPTQISSDEKHLLLMWKDGQVSELDFFELRFQCPCAGCVNELTGVRTLKKENIKKDIAPVSFRPVGKYGLQIQWNDGHNTGIYTFNHLRNF